MRRAGRAVWALSALVLLCSGCRGNLELNEIHIVHSVGLDTGKNGGVKVYAEIARLASGQQPKGMQNRTFMLTAEGSNLFEAARLMRVKSDRTLLWGQTTAIVISKDIARQGIERQIETFRRFRQFRNTTLVYMVDGSASEILKVEIPNSSISAQALRGLAEGGESTALTDPTTLLDIYMDWSNGFQDIRIPAIKVVKDRTSGKEEKLLKAVGFFAFRGSRLAGFMSARVSKGYLRAANLLKSSSEKLICPGESGTSVAFENTKNTTRLSVSVDASGTPSVRIEVDADLNLVGAACEDVTVTPELIADWEKQLNEEIADQIDDFIAFSKRHKTDLLGIGERIHRKQPQRWKQMKDDWAEIYPTSRFSVTVHTRIDHTNFTV